MPELQKRVQSIQTQKCAFSKFIKIDNWNTAMHWKDNFVLHGNLGETRAWLDKEANSAANAVFHGKLLQLCCNKISLLVIFAILCKSSSFAAYIEVIRCRLLSEL